MPEDFRVDSPIRTKPHRYVSFNLLKHPPLFDSYSHSIWDGKSHQIQGQDNDSQFLGLQIKEFIWELFHLSPGSIY